MSPIKALRTSKKTFIMGILNVTPDSFSDGGLYYKNLPAALNRVEEMVSEGADIIDVGGESTRPGSDPVSSQKELERILPVIKAIRKKLGPSLFLSVDTYKSEVASECLKNGANMINSIGGFKFDKNLAEAISFYQSPFVIYHIKGKPKTMQSGSMVYKDVVGDIINFFKVQIDFGMKQGIKKEQFILDPGIGFGKTAEQNIEIIRRFKELKKLKTPLMVGVSRKSHLGTLLKDKLEKKEMPGPLERIEAGLAEAAFAVLQGARIVRTHDVAATKKFFAVLDAIKNYART